MKDIHPVLKKETKVIQLRTVPSELHKALSHAALDEGMTLEKYAVRVLARAMRVNEE